MKPTIYLLIVITVIIIGLFRFYSNQSLILNPNIITPSEDNNAKRSSSTRHNDSNSDSGVEHPHPSATEAQWVEREAKIKAVFAQNDGHMDFYGKVVDQNGNSIPKVKVNYAALGKGRIMYSKVMDDPDKYFSTVTGNDGFFEIHNLTEFGVSIESLEKVGYRGKIQNRHTFTQKGSPSPFNPIRENPVEFMMIKLDMPKLKKICSNKTLKFTWNNGEIKAPLGDSGINFCINPTRERSEGQIEGFSWKVIAFLEGAQFEEISFGDTLLAPIEGYGTEQQYEYLKHDSNWARTIHKKYAFKTPSGLYGFIEIYLDAVADDDSSEFSITAKINESGARNLE